MYPGTVAAARSGPARRRHGRRRDGHLPRARRGIHPLARLLREIGLRPGDHFAVLMENHPSLPRGGVGGPAQRALRHGHQLAPHRGRSGVHRRRLRGQGAGHQSRPARRWPRSIVPPRPSVRRRLMVDGAAPRHEPTRAQTAASSPDPIDDESRGMVMLYSSGTTGRPKGVEFPLPLGDASRARGRSASTAGPRYGFREGMVYLTPAPLYHAAPLRVSLAVQSLGGTVVVMERFDPSRALDAHRAGAGDAQPVGADHVRPHVEAARAERPAPTCRATSSPSMPPRRARSP